MKHLKLMLGLFAIALLGLFTACEDDPVDESEAINITLSQTEATVDVGDTLSFDISVVCDAKIEKIEVRKGTATYDTKTEFTNNTSDVYKFKYVGAEADAGTSLAFAVIVTDKKGNEDSENFIVNVNALLTPFAYETTGSILGNKIGPDQSAWNLVTNVRESGSATSDMQNPSLPSGTVAEQWIKGWDSETTTMFVKDNAYDYENAAVETAATAYSAGTATAEIRDVAVGDVYIAKLRGTEEYAVIKVTKVDDAKTAAPRNEEIEFSYKKTVATAGS